MWRIFMWNKKSWFAEMQHELLKRANTQHRCSYRLFSLKRGFGKFDLNKERDKKIQFVNELANKLKFNRNIFFDSTKILVLIFETFAVTPILDAYQVQLFYTLLSFAIPRDMKRVFLMFITTEVRRSFVCIVWIMEFIWKYSHRSLGQIEKKCRGL